MTNEERTRWKEEFVNCINKAAFSLGALSGYCSDWRYVEQYSGLAQRLDGVMEDFMAAYKDESSFLDRQKAEKVQSKES